MCTDATSRRILMSKSRENAAVASGAGIVASRRPKLAVDQFLPGTAASSLSTSGLRKKRRSCICQASGPYQSSVQWILDTGRRVTRPSDWQGIGETKGVGEEEAGSWTRRGEGRHQSGGWGAASEAGQPGRHNIVRRGGDQRTTTGILSSQPNHVLSTQTSSRTLILKPILTHTQTHTYVFVSTQPPHQTLTFTPSIVLAFNPDPVLCVIYSIFLSKMPAAGPTFIFGHFKCKMGQKLVRPLPLKKNNVKTHSKSRIQNCLTRRRDEHWRKVRSAEYIENCGTRKVFEFPAR